MAPHFTWVKWKPFGQQPHFCRNAVDAVPIVHAQDAQPKFGPRRRVQSTAMVGHERSSGLECLVGGLHAQQTHGDVTQCRTKHGGGGFNMSTPSTVRLLVVA